MCRDRYEFIAYAFARYYGIVTPIVRKYDPNHLYLGSRINYTTGEHDNPWFWKMLAPYHDVVSVNYYGRWGPQADELADWAAWADRPILFTEWYAKAMDVVPKLANTHGAGWVVRTQEDRARYYQHFALARWSRRTWLAGTFSSTRTIHRNRKTSTTWAARTKACLTSTGSRTRRCSNAPRREPRGLSADPVLRREAFARLPR